MKYLRSLGRVLFGFFFQFLLVYEETGDSDTILSSKVYNLGKSWDTHFFLSPCCTDTPIGICALEGQLLLSLSWGTSLPVLMLLDTGVNEEGGAESGPPCTPDTNLGVHTGPSGHQEPQPRSSLGKLPMTKSCARTKLIIQSRVSQEYCLPRLLICRYGWSGMACVSMGVASLCGVKGSEPGCSRSIPCPVDALG